MHKITIGSFLVATPLLNNTDFASTKIFIHQSDAHGAVGFIINKPFHRTLNELAEFSNSKSIRLYNGGPVDREHLFVLHRRPDVISNSGQITDHVYFGGEFNEAVRLLNSGQISEHDVRIFIGYCGWDLEQLQEEIEEGSWKLETKGDDMLFG